MKPGYKQTEAGVIPEQWDVKSFAQLLAFRNGVNADKDAYGQGIPFINVLEPITYSHIRGPEITGRVTLPPAVAASYAVKVGDILFNRTSETESELGLASSFLGTDQVVFGGFVIRGRPLDESLDPVYSGYALRAPAIRSQIIPMGQGAIRSNIGQQSLRLVLAPVPPLPEQRAIAAALSDVDALLGSLDRLIAKKRDLKQAAMQQLLTYQTRLPSFHGDWEVKTIQELSHVGRGRVISHSEISRSPSPTYPVFSSQTSNDGVMGYLHTYDFEGDYVTWTTDGANAGTVFARSGRFNCTNVCGTIKLHNSDHRFIAAALGRVSQPHVSRHLGNPKLMNDVMKKIEITIPHTRAEQTAIAEVLTDMDAELAALEQRREKTRNVKQAMMQELLTGKTRLV